MLLDANIFNTQEFMLWIKWDKTHLSNLCNYSFETHYINDRDDRACMDPHYEKMYKLWFGMDGTGPSIVTETQNEIIAQFRFCKKQCKRLYNAKFNKYKKYKHNNKYRYHRC
eukprot:23417_1